MHKYRKTRYSIDISNDIHSKGLITHHSGFKPTGSEIVPFPDPGLKRPGLLPPPDEE